MEKPNPLEEILDELNRKARDWPPDKFFDHVDLLVESSRRHIQAQEDDEVKESLVALYREIVRFAFACKVGRLHEEKPLMAQSGGARC